MHHETTMKKVWCEVFLNSHPKCKESIQKLDAKSRNSPGQCLGITKDLRTTGDYVASHKLSHKRSWQCSLLLRWINRLPFPIRGLSISLKKKKEQRPRKSIQSRSWSSTNHKNTSLQLSQIDSHLCAVTGFPHPDLHKKERKKKGAGRYIVEEKGKPTVSNTQTSKSSYSYCQIWTSLLLRVHRWFSLSPSPSPHEAFATWVENEVRFLTLPP